MTFIPLPNPVVTKIHPDQRDAFSRLRVSNPTSLLYSQHQYDKLLLLWDEALTGAATSVHNADRSAVDISTTTASGDKAVHQTIEYFRYQPGKSQLIFLSFTLDSPQTNLSQCVGYFDDDNGIFLEQVDASTVQIVERTKVTGSVVNNTVAQASWNMDALDGNGTSGITLDLTKAQILVIDLQWLGTGRVRVGFDINGIVMYVHEFFQANEDTGPYMTTANLPITFEIENTGTIAGAATLQVGCGSVTSEGGTEIGHGFPFSVDSTLGAGLISVAGTTEVPILGLRTALTFNSITNHGQILVRNLECFALDQPCVVRLYYNPTVTGGTWSVVNANSIAEANDNITSISGGHVLTSFFIAAATAAGNNSIPGVSSRGPTSLLPITHKIDNSLIPVVLTVENLTASAVDVAASLDWLELR